MTVITETKPRTVIFDFDPDVREKVMEIVRSDCEKLNGDRSAKPFWDALGYLADWAYQEARYQYVDIYLSVWNEEIDIVARYRPSADDSVQYTIVAFWRHDEGRFTFHS
jgi:hypothetical protein